MNGIWVTNRIARTLNRKMKARGYRTTIATLTGRYGMAIVEAFAGSDVGEQKQIEIMITDSYDAVHHESRD